MASSRTQLSLWTRDSTQKLISEVQQRECLWNTALPEYRNQSLKVAAWDEIAQIMGVPRTVVFNKWHSLRISFPALQFLNTLPETNTNHRSNHPNFSLSTSRATAATNDTNAAASQIWQHNRTEEVIINRNKPPRSRGERAEDVWDITGNVVTLSGSHWEEHNASLAKEFRADLFKLVHDFQKKVNEVS